MVDPLDLPVEDVDAPGAQWWGRRGSRQRVRSLVQWMVDQNEQRKADANRTLNERFERSWAKTNALFDPPSDMRAMHKRLHLPLYTPQLDPVPDLPPDPDARDGVPDDYVPTAEPMAGSESVTDEEQP